jgi:hypothetical protein
VLPLVPEIRGLDEIPAPAAAIQGDRPGVPLHPSSSSSAASTAGPPRSGVNAGVMREALRQANGDASRIRIISPTCVEVSG